MSSVRHKVTRAAIALGLIAMVSTASTHLFAQAVQPVTDVPAKTTKTPSDDDVVQMSAFTVSTTKNNDYVASETITGTRLATKVADLPFQVNIITSEFISDFAAYDLSEELGYTSNFSPSPGSGTPILRGFKTVPYLDGFRRITGSLPAGVDTDTTTVIKGPAASIYGQTVPGGVVNRTLKHPETKQKSGIGVAIGSNNTLRANAYTTGPLGTSGKLFYRVAVENDSNTYDQMYADAHTTYASVQFLWKPTASFSWNTRISYDLDHNHDRTAVPFVKNHASNVYAGGTYTYTGRTANTPVLDSVNPYTNSPQAVADYTTWVNANWDTTTNTWKGGVAPAPYAASAQLNTWAKWTGLDYESVNIRSSGYLGETYNRWTNFNTYADKRWNNFISTKATFDYIDNGYHRQTVSGNQTYNPNPDAASLDSNGQYTIPNTTRDYNMTPGRYVNGSIGNQTPEWDYQPYRNIAFQMDNAMKFKLGPVNNQLLVTFDFNHVDQTNYVARYQNTSGGNAVVMQPVTGTPYPINSTGDVRKDLPIGLIPRNYPLTAADFYYPSHDLYPWLYSQVMNDNITKTDDYGIFVSERASMFKNRLRAFVGLRYDYIQNSVEDHIARQTPAWTTSAWTPQAGVSGVITQNFIAFANYSTAYQPIAQYKGQWQDGMYTASVFPNEKSYGYEFGLRYSAFQQKLNATVSYFYINRQNVLNSYTDPETNVTNYDSSGNQDARGIDFDFNWVVTDSLQIGGGYGYNDAKYTYCALPYLIGTTTPGAVRNNYAFNARYSFKNGVLKGLSMGGGVKYYEKSMVNPGSGIVYYYDVSNPTASSSQVNFYNVRMTNGNLPYPNLPEGTPISTTANPHTYKINVSDGREQVFNLPYALFDFWIKYNFRSTIYGGRVNQSVQLNLKNAFDRFYTYGSATVGNGRQILVSYNLTF